MSLPQLIKTKQAAYIYKWTPTIAAMLPEHYKRRCMDFMTRDPTPVHWRPDDRKYKLVSYSAKKYRKAPLSIKLQLEETRVPVQNVGIVVVYPEECNKGLWGGEGVIQGFSKKGSLKPRLPKLWRPYLTKRALYSEIFDTWFAITVTLRTLKLIDEACGFDSYILKTNERDLNSKLGMDLKREMLLALARQSLHLDNPEKRKRLLQKYKEYLIPAEEAEWVGLSVNEAIAKVNATQRRENPAIPLRDLLTVDLIERQHMESDSTEKSDKSSWLSKFNPFQDKSSGEKDKH